MEGLVSCWTCLSLFFGVDKINGAGARQSRGRNSASKLHQFDHGRTWGPLQVGLFHPNKSPFEGTFWRWFSYFSGGIWIRSLEDTHLKFNISKFYHPKKGKWYSLPIPTIHFQVLLNCYLVSGFRVTNHGRGWSFPQLVAPRKRWSTRRRCVEVLWCMIPSMTYRPPSEVRPKNRSAAKKRGVKELRKTG